MRVEKKPYSFPLQAFFPAMKVFSAFESSMIWLSERDGCYYFILDYSPYCAYLIEDEDDDILDELIEIYEFDTEFERNMFIEERGWNSFDRRKREGVIENSRIHLSEFGGND